ncbi:hypothetical protein [Ferrovibrio terrae]|uniref:hypothetical protein n=1 Tax=Ferrovibrio terrae TaxID=2594003 RepID=UPI003137B694
MDTLLDWAVKNFEWIFGGIGVAIITGLFSLFRKKTAVQKQNGGANSINIQSGGDTTIKK